MYGVFCTTPPQQPASTVASGLGQEDVAGAVLVARGRGALGVVDAADDRDERERQRDRQIRQRRRQRVEPAERRPRQRQPQRARASRARSRRQAEPRAPQKMSVPGEHRAKAPGSPSGIRTRPKSARSSTTSATSPTSGSRRILSAGRNAISRIETPADRAQQRRARAPPGGPVPREREAELGEADRDRRRHADLPREHRIAGREHHRPQHAEHHREQGRRVDAERHRGDVRAASPAHEPYREPRVGEIADEHAERGARHHPLQHQVGRELEDADQERRQDDELRDVVEGEAEEPVQVSRPDPGRSARASGRRRLPGWRRSAHARRSRPLGESGAPREAPAIVGDVAVLELHGRGRGVAEAQPRAVRLPFTLAARRPARPRREDRRAWRARSGNSRASARLPCRFRPRTRRRF